MKVQLPLYIRVMHGSIWALGAYPFLLVACSPIVESTCDGHGPANGTIVEYYEDGAKRSEGTVKDCLWDSTFTTYYPSGGIESTVNYSDGKRHGLATYFSTNGTMYQRETYLHGELLGLLITDTAANMTYRMDRRELSFDSPHHWKSMFFEEPLSLYGSDLPFAQLYKDKLILRGTEDFYVIDHELNVLLDLRDTLMKYIPTAYVQRVDVSGNTFTFLWHRTISNDTLHVRVFYDGDKHQANQRTWESHYALWKLGSSLEAASSSIVAEPRPSENQGTPNRR